MFDLLIPARLRHGFKLGLRSLAAHRLRSGLTALGIVLGVMSVIVMLAVGEAARFQALKQLEDLGANTILLRSVKPADVPTEQKGADMLAYGVTYADWGRITSTIPTVVSATPLREYRKTLWHRDKKVESRIVGVTPEFFAQSNIRILRGRGFEPADDRTYANVCVLGAAAAEVLFPAADPIGKTVGIDNFDELKAFTVVGLTAPKTLATGGLDAGDTDFTKVLFIPFGSDRVRFGRELLSIKAGSYQMERLEISRLTVQVADLADVPRTAAAIQGCLDRFHPNKDVVVAVPLDLLQKAEQTQRLFTLILGAIAGVSLLVGGIGIMNIMLATVTERTREIGIRRALGAKRRDIAWQFLIETVVLSCGGGLLGVALGVGLTVLLERGFGVPAVLRLWGPAVAFSVSVAVGLASGLYPARRAARLDPIEALRYN